MTLKYNEINTTLTPNEETAKKVFFYEIPAEHPIDTYVADFAHAMAKIATSDILHDLRCYRKNKFDIYLNWFSALCIAFPGEKMASIVHALCGTGYPYNLMEKIVLSSFFRDEFCAEYVKQLETFFGKAELSSFQGMNRWMWSKRSIKY